MSLYEITAEMMTLINAFNDHGKDSPEAESAFREHASALAEAFDSKADAYASLIRTCEVRAAARRQEADRMTTLADADETLADRLRAAMLQAMVATNRLKVETDRFRLAVRQNGGKIPIVIENPAAIPHEYMIAKMVTTVDRDSIRSTLEAGGTVEGAVLGERRSRLDIR